jgi:dTDP-4-dehydrorhamnose 3,5-epimerase
MKTLPTTLPGVVLLELDVHADARGRFVELFRREDYAALGMREEFVQDNVASSARGSLRGLHYQHAHPQGKLVCVTHGEVFDVAVDLRRGAATFGQWFGCLLSADNARQLWVPPGFAHGFLATSERADVVYKCTAYYAPGDERAVRWDDAELGIAWPLDGAPTLSAKDAAAPSFAQARAELGA